MTETERRDWTDYRSTGDVGVRNRLVERHLALVRHFALRLEPTLGGAVEGEDLVSAGVVGLMAAVSAYDPGRGYRFSTFAAGRIRGSMLDEVRRRDVAPRAVRRRERELESARAHLSVELNRSPRQGEVAELLGVDLPTLWRWEWEVARSRRVSLLDVVEEESAARWSSWAPWWDGGVESRLAREDDVARLRAALAALSGRERLIVRLHDLESRTLREIATELGVTESRVSQLRTRALGRLRAWLVEPKRVA